VFLERKIVKKVYGEDYYKIEAYNANSGMLDDIEGFGEDESYSSLFPNTAGKNPDDSFSTVPYEKGFQFLTFLESFIGE
jgi:leukotriene-A4 hydrolase